MGHDPRIYTLTGCIGLIGANSLSLAPIAPSISTALEGAAVNQVLWIAGGFGLGTAISALALAPLVDRYGAAPLLRLSCAILILCFGASSVAQTLWALIALQTLAGLASGVALPATYGLGADIAPKGREAQTLGFILTGWMVAMVLGATVATIVADLISWRVLFLGFGAIALILFILLMRIQVPPFEPKPSVSPLTALNIPGIWRALAVVGAFMLAFYGIYPFVAIQLVDTLSYTAAATALPILAYGIGFGVSSIFDPLIDRYGYHQFGRWAFGIAIILFGVMSVVAHDFIGLIVIMGLYGLLNHAMLTLIMNRLIALDPAQKGTILGLYAFLTYACVSIGAVGFAPVFAWGGFTAVGLAAAGCALFLLIELCVPIKHSGSEGR